MKYLCSAKQISYISSVALIASFGVPLTNLTMAGALAMAGEIDLAFEILPDEIHPEVFEPETGGNFSSGVRTNAILLDVLLEIDPKSGHILEDEEAIAYWSRTYEKGWEMT